MRTFDAEGVAGLERRYATPQIVEQRKAFRAILAARAGEAGLDVGCGPGYLTCELAKEVAPAGRIVAIDKSDAAVDATRTRTVDERLADMVEVFPGDAVKLDFPDNTFDFVVSTQVYCYVPDVGGAIREAARVLRDGGRLAVLETDWDLATWNSADRAMTRRILAARNTKFAHAHLPGRLPGMFRDAGLTLGDVRVFPFVETRYDPDSFGAEAMKNACEAALGEGVPAADVTAWERDLRACGAAGEWFFCVNRFIFTAAKPRRDAPA
jgi:arsenite methyltransferase